MQSISTAELHKKITAGEDIQLIDVREPWEHELYNIGGELIPLGSLLENIGRINTVKPVVFYCQKGIRSQIAIQRLIQKTAYHNLFNLEGGMAAWQKDSLPPKE
ncbi:hypothetical protein BH11BAC4_BH11BAC4_17890 [soil metagenome]